MCENVETAQGVPLTVTGVAQCKIMKVRSIGYATAAHTGKSSITIKLDLILRTAFINWHLIDSRAHTKREKNPRKLLFFFIS